MVLHIKNMLSSRCISAVQQELRELHIDCPHAELGHVEIDGNLSDKQSDLLRERLHAVGLELIQDKKTQISNQIKYLIDELMSSNEDNSDVQVSAYLKNQLNMDYIHLAKAFADRNPLTLKQYIIAERVNKVKELIREQHWKLAEISNLLHYSSTAHLCNEFKKVTGFTPKLFKDSYQRG
jgi:AraC-like DNA-binding protein